MSAPMEALDDRSGSVFVVTLVLSIAATVFVALRLASKGLVVRKLTSDDYVTVLAWVFAVGLSVSIMLGAKRGLGAPDSAILPEWQDALKRTVYAFTVLYNPALMATKTAILILYVRMAAAHPFLRYASIATGVIVNLAGLILTLISVFQCRPVRAGYEDIDGECVDVVSLYLSSAPINILTDLAILALPLPILTRLRMEFKQKCALVATFVVGGFVTVVDVVRIIYLQNALREEREWSIYSTITLTTPPPNFTYHASFSLMWSAVEVNVGLMCACVLVLKPLIMRVMPGFLGGTISRSRRESRKERDTPESGSGQEKEQRPELSISVQQPTPVPEIYSPTAGVFGDRGLMIDLPGNNLCAIPERAQLADEDDGMDFFQMLASDPKCPAAGSLRKMSMSSHSTQSPATVHRARLSDAFTEISERDERDADGVEGSAQRDGRPDEDGSDDGMDFFQMLAADPPMTPATGSPVPLPTAVVAPRKRSLVRRATVSLARRVPGSLGTDRAPSPPPLPVQEPTQNFFDFVNMKSRTPLTQLSKKEAWWPIMFVSILFFLWGFAYGLLGTLNAQIQSLLHYSPGSTFALHNAYWIGYLIGPPVCGYWVLSKEGFKATFMTGLAIYATGAMSFWPSSVLKSYGGFFVSNVIIATGLSVLETAANPFIALAGPGELSEARLCFSQGIQGLGSIISPILAAKALFSGIDEEDLFRVQYCYLAVAILVVALAVVFFYVPLSEATDDELEAMATQRLYNAGLDKGEKAYRLDARQLVLWTGVIMMATYVGAQESVSYFWTPIIRTAQPDVDPFWMQAAGHCVFAFGRFAAAGLIYIRVTPRLIMFGCMIGCVITSAVAFASPPGDTPVAFLILALFFEAPLFPLIFAMSLRGQGKHTKFASTVVTMAISGGAIWPSVTYGVDMRHADARYAVRVTMGLYAAALLWPIILSASRKLRRWVDPKWSRIRVIEGGVVETGGSPGSGGMPSHADSHTHTHTHVIDWASPTMGKRDLTHVETSAAPDLGESVDSHEQRSNVHHLDHSDRAGQGRGSEEEKRNPLGNPLGISIPGGWRRNSGKDGRKRSVTWEKE